VIKRKELKNMPVTVMGLGLNGGGLASARFLAQQGAQVTVTDLRNEETLAPSMKELKDLPIRYVLGKHEEEDFRNAAMVIKNPAVPPESPYLQMAKQIETDISLFLNFCQNPLLAVTGTKGKSTTVSALFHILKAPYPGCRLGGNITISPLSFLDDLAPEDPVILELSSWQLADLKGKGLLHPEIAIITNLMHDHQNRYKSFQDYINDKLLIYSEQQANQISLLPAEEMHRGWSSLASGRQEIFSTAEDSFTADRLFGFRNYQGWFRNSKGEEELIIDQEIPLPGRHIRSNLLIAGAMARLFGVDLQTVRKRLQNFPGVEHRMELCGQCRDIQFYNDTAATIPDAMVAAMESFTDAPVLICGGTDKELDMTPMEGKMDKAKEIFLLKGSATDRMIEILNRENISFHGPFESLQEAFELSIKNAAPGDRIILSPGATSFGMFLNEFDRGNQFRSLVQNLCKNNQ